MPQLHIQPKFSKRRQTMSKDEKETTKDPEIDRRRKEIARLRKEIERHQEEIKEAREGLKQSIEEAKLASLIEKTMPNPDAEKIDRLQADIEEWEKILNPNSKENTKSSKNSASSTEKFNYSTYEAEILGFGAAFMRKEVANVTEAGSNLVVEFEQGSLLTQGVVFPKDLGFKPEKGMRVIYDSDGSMGSAGRVLFYDSKSENPLFVATRSSGEPN